jgi:hypothetical protein
MERIEAEKKEKRRNDFIESQKQRLAILEQKVREQTQFQKSMDERRKWASMYDPTQYQKFMAEREKQASMYEIEQKVREQTQFQKSMDERRKWASMYEIEKN